VQPLRITEGEPLPLPTGVPGGISPRGRPFPKQQCTLGLQVELRSLNGLLRLNAETIILTPTECANAKVAFKSFQSPVTVKFQAGIKTYTGINDDVSLQLTDNRFALFAGFAPPPWEFSIKTPEEQKASVLIAFVVDDKNLDSMIPVAVKWAADADADTKDIANVEQVFGSLRIVSAFENETGTILSIESHLPVEVVLSQIRAVVGVENALIAPPSIETLLEIDRARRAAVADRGSARAVRETRAARNKRRQ
jgi:hypothetical protein